MPEVTQNTAPTNAESEQTDFYQLRIALKEALHAALNNYVEVSGNILKAGKVSLSSVLSDELDNLLRFHFKRWRAGKGWNQDDPIVISYYNLKTDFPNPVVDIKVFPCSAAPGYRRLGDLDAGMEIRNKRMSLEAMKVTLGHETLQRFLSDFLGLMQADKESEEEFLHRAARYTFEIHPAA